MEDKLESLSPRSSSSVVSLALRFAALPVERTLLVVGSVGPFRLRGNDTSSQLVQGQPLR